MHGFKLIWFFFVKMLLGFVNDLEVPYFAIFSPRTT